MKNKEKISKNRLPTTEEFLGFRPKRLDFFWSTDSKGIVEIKVQKFNSKFGKTFCKLIKKENIFIAKMDKIGSTVWKNCDGENTIKEILEIIKNNFPKEENIDQRLFSFIQQMVSLNYIDY